MEVDISSPVIRISHPRGLQDTANQSSRRRTSNKTASSDVFLAFHDILSFKYLSVPVWLKYG